MSIFLITGERHAGKTTYLTKLIDIFIKKGFSVGGFINEGIFQNGVRDGFFVKSLNDNKKELFADKNECADLNNVHFGGYTFYKKGFDFAYKEYETSLTARKNFIAVDEIGRWELEGGGLIKLLDKMPVFSTLLIVCRKEFTADINSVFFNNYGIVVDIRGDIFHNACKIMDSISKTGQYA